MYEAMTSLLFQMACANSHGVIDVGAHDGHFTRIAGKEARAVYAFEPRRDIYNKLRRNVPMGAVVHRLAVSDKSGEADLHFAPERRYTASLKPEPWRTMTERVRTITLDQMFARAQIGAIKIDVEGAEPEVIRGAARTIKANRPTLFVEVLNDTIGAEITAALPCPYSYHRIYEDTMSVRSLEALIVGREWGNFMLLPLN